MFFILINKLKIFILFISIVTIAIGVYIKKFQELSNKDMEYFYPHINESIQYEKITSKNSTKLFSYFFRKGELKKAHTWNQICLFFKNQYCIYYSEYPGLLHEDDEMRKNSFINNKNDFITKKKGISEEEKQCYSIYYKTQDDINMYRKEFLDNYNKCSIYYLANLPALKEYEQNFLDIFKNPLVFEKY